MNVAQFRKSLKEQLDRAVRGEIILIERAGVTFKLYMVPPAEHHPDAYLLPPKVAKKHPEVKKQVEKAADKMLGLCEHHKAKGMCMAFGCPHRANA